MLRTNLATGDFGDNFTIPKLEPLFIDEIKMHRNELKATFRVKSVISIRVLLILIMILQNLVVSGPSNFVLKNMR